MKDKPNHDYGCRCVRDEIYEFLPLARKFKIDPIDFYKILKKLACNPCINACQVRKCRWIIEHKRKRGGA